MRKFGSLDEHAGIVEVDFSHEELARIDAEQPPVAGERYDEAALAAVSL